MIKTFSIFILLLVTQNILGQEYSDAFIVTIKDDKIRVVSPKEKQKVIGVIIKNETFDNITSEVRSDLGVIERFVLKSQGSKSLQINFSKIQTLYYVSIAPPFQAVELKFSQRAYEIPETK